MNLAALDVVLNGLVPVLLFFLGQRYIKSKERADIARQNAASLASFLEHLSSDNKQTRKLSLLALAHMRDGDAFPKVLFQSVESIASVDDPEVAAYAEVALGNTHLRAGLDQAQRTLLLELLLPIKIHLERSRTAFERWTEVAYGKPNLEMEDAIKASNGAISSLLRSRWHLVPRDLQADAVQLLEHYDAWLAEYDRLRPDGVRDLKVPYVFVGPQGFPFPREAEQHFLSRYEALAGEPTHAGSA